MCTDSTQRPEYSFMKEYMDIDVSIDIIRHRYISTVFSKGYTLHFLEIEIPNMI